MWDGLVDTEGREKMGWTERVALTFVLPCVKQRAGSGCRAQGMQPGALWWPEQWNGDGVGAKLQREGTYMHIELIHIAVEQKWIQHRKAMMLLLLCLLLLFSCSVVSDSFATPWTVACQAPLPMEFSRQEYWSGFARHSSREIVPT